MFGIYCKIFWIFFMFVALMFNSAIFLDFLDTYYRPFNLFLNYPDLFLTIYIRFLFSNPSIAILILFSYLPKFSCMTSEISDRFSYIYLSLSFINGKLGYTPNILNIRYGEVLPIYYILVNSSCCSY